MSNMNFDDYENLFSNINPEDSQQAQQLAQAQAQAQQQAHQQRERTQMYLQQQQQFQQQQLLQQQAAAQAQAQAQQQQQSQAQTGKPLQQHHKSLSQHSITQQQPQPIMIGDSISHNIEGSVFSPTYDNANNAGHNHHNQPDSRSRFGSYTSNSSHFDSEVNFNDLNDAVSSINSGILSPYSTGSSPDDFFLSATNSNVDSQYSQDQDDYNVDLRNNQNLNNDILYPQPLVPVPMAESASNSTVTFNTHDNYHNVQQNMAQLNTVDEDDEEYNIKKESPSSLLDDPSSDGYSQMKHGRKVKSSHNLIEKKYRTNINSKIIELRNCVPALRILVAKNGNHRTRSTGKEVEETDDYYEGDGYSDDEEKLDGLKPAKKLNKATILSKASEYIRHLEKKNDVLREQNYSLRKLLESRGIRTDSLFSQHQQQQLYQDSSLHSSPFNNSSGSNLVSPDPNFSNLNAAHLQNHLQNQLQTNNPNQLMPDHKALSNKLMMGNISSVLGTNALNEFINTQNIPK